MDVDALYGPFTNGPARRKRRTHDGKRRTHDGKRRTHDGKRRPPSIGIPEYIPAMKAEQLECHVVTPPGVEEITAGECRDLGLTVDGTEPGGVGIRTDSRGLFLANLHLRTASRILVRIGEFHAATFYQLEDRLAALPWSRVLPKGVPVSLRVTSRTSRLYHQRGIAERVAGVLAKVDSGWTVVPGSEVEESASQLVLVRMSHDRCQVRVDSSGVNLHRRGYRSEGGEAPVRETIAAALLMASGWSGTTPLLDPMSGSGTFPIEAALIARRIPPGLNRSFACERWPGHDPALAARVREEARAGILPRATAPIMGGDRSVTALAAAERNAERAGVAEDVTWRRADLRDWRGSSSGSLIVSNPPYGVRVGRPEALRGVHAELGELARSARPGAPGLALLTPETATAVSRVSGVALRSAFLTSNGGIRVRGLVSS